MKPLGRGARAGMFVRSFFIQGSWNYRSLLGAGFAFALLPALRALYRDEPAQFDRALERHLQLFNSHPYLAPMALGAVARLEAEGEDAAVVERFKAAVRGSLGTLGDRLVWAGWRPACLLFAMTMILAGGRWWLGIAGFLLLYNAGHLALRVWAYRLGLREGRHVGERLRRSRIVRAQGGLAAAGAFLLGCVMPLAATGAIVQTRLPLAWAGLALAAGFLGASRGLATRTTVILALAGVALLGLGLGIAS